MDWVALQSLGRSNRRRVIVFLFPGAPFSAAKTAETAEQRATLTHTRSGQCWENDYPESPCIRTRRDQEHNTHSSMFKFYL